ncbi:MAG: hypothetical protein WA945_02580 [Arcobacteraceae bacterium]
MKNNSFKNILILFLALIAIMSLSTLLTLSFNFLIGFSTDIQNDDVATSIAAVAFGIGVLLKYLYEKREIKTK